LGTSKSSEVREVKRSGVKKKRREIKKLMIEVT